MKKNRLAVLLVSFASTGSEVVTAITSNPIKVNKRLCSACATDLHALREDYSVRERSKLQMKLTGGEREGGNKVTINWGRIDIRTSQSQILPLGSSIWPLESSIRLRNNFIQAKLRIRYNFGKRKCKKRFGCNRGKK